MIKSTILRQPISDAEMPGYAARRDGRDRGPRLLPARRDRLPLADPRRAHRPHLRQDAAGRLDDHDAARPQPLPGGRRRAHLLAQDQGGDRRLRVRGQALEALDPHRLPQHRPLRDRRRPDRRGRAGGVVDVLRPPGLRRHARAVGAPRRPAAGADGLQPVLPPERRARPPQPGARGDGAVRLHHPGAGGAARVKPLGVKPNDYYKDFHESYFIDFVTQELRRATARRCSRRATSRSTRRSTRA